MTHSTIIAIGTSAGGVDALRGLVAALPQAFSAPILIVLHIGAHRSELPGILNAAGRLPAKHPDNSETIAAGHIYVALPDHHMVVSDGKLRLLRTPKENWARPAIDPLFRSVAEDYGPNAIGVILTGLLNDGSLGLGEIKRRGGIAIVQDPDDAAYPEMPGSAAAHVAPDRLVPLSEMPGLLVELVNGKDGKDAPMPNKPSQPGPGLTSPTIDREKFDRPTALTCPECGGALHRSEDGTIIKFDCHIGHSYTGEVLASAQFDEMERVMRAAVRFLNERAEFCLEMAEQARLHEPGAAPQWEAASKQALDRAYKLRALVEQDWLMPEAFGAMSGRMRKVSG
ncbi:chemotaxis protein CheB [Mesorhizobium sp. RCC_202]|uniref:chemotaxis protein CheB n=1 Tax=Mesorhizobium sp. RCC_202 TaxID=3239222 RepID=UPI003524A2B0